MNQKIFISLASYCDDMLFFTIESCYKNAQDPKNLIFGIVDQNTNSKIDKLKTYPFYDQIRYVFINKTETYGVSWARNLVFSLWDYEEYLLQIDSHTLFEENWDQILKKQYQELKQQSKKPIISVYPHGFTIDENMNTSFKKPSGDYVMVLRAKVTSRLTEENAVLQFQAEPVKTKEHQKGYHLAAGFLFTNGSFIEEIPYDPYLYFHGEEQSLAIRSFTKGWDIFHPNWIPLYHMYKKTDPEGKKEFETHHWNSEIKDKRSLSYAHLLSRARERLNRLLYQDGLLNSVYGLGNQRTLDEYIHYSKIDYKNKVIYNLK